MKIDRYAEIRGFISPDEDFPPKLDLFVQAYNSISHQAYITAKLAAGTGTLPDIRKSQWNEAITKLLERVIISIAHQWPSDPNMIWQDLIPEPPNFTV